MVSATMAGQVTAPMPAQRLAAFRSVVAARLRLGSEATIAPQVMVDTLRREQQALTVALNDETFLNSMTVAFAAEMSAFDKSLPIEEVKTQMKGILNNRIRDARQFIALLNDPNFIASAQAEALQPVPPAKPYDLSPEKKEEIVRRLVQADDLDGNEPAVHIAAAALGQRIVHQALANIYRPQQGNLTEPLIGALAKAWPEASGAQLRQLATSWLKARHDPAHETAKYLDSRTGALYHEAIRRVSAQKDQQRTIPAAQIAAPADGTGKLASAAADLMMDTI